MASIDVVTMENQKAGSVDLPAAVFEAKVSPHLFHAEVRRQLAGRRSGTHSTRNRALVSGGGAKPYRQKGTGRARQGSIRAPHYSGGGVVFGPVPRTYDHKIPKKVRRAALAGSLSLRQSESAVTVVDSLAFDEFKTKRVVAMLDALGLSGKSVLIVLDEKRPAVEASARNIPGVTVIRAEGLNVYDVLRHSNLVLTRAAVDQIETRLTRPVRGSSNGSEEASS